ncbi:hypothetical protein MKK84_05840 [Methylobacterium sp. E-065]|uniref:hypothetical protein n=1 Tax=Methylobacterium sp. E-065 TaxID=2836583 RepID=UPI001FB9A6AA|nr:hypothetical protein [Methylobacterium sp. E-065]MCJ2016950.1 hypothetical protein [Methylobacterium sp. E-065]
MTPAHLKSTMAALAIAGTPPHLRASQGTTMSASPVLAPAAGAAPQGAAPRTAAQETLDWDGIVAGLNATLPVAQAEEAAR